jgi:hypothetical protein
MRWVGHVARMEEETRVYKVFLGKPEGKRALSRLRRRWEDNIKTDLKELEYDGVDCIYVVQYRYKWLAFEIRSNKPSSSTQFGQFSFTTCQLPKKGYVP